MQDALYACSAEADSGKVVAGSKSAFSIPNVCFGATTMSLEGQQETFADAPRVFVPNVRNLEGNPTADGQNGAFARMT
jgi:hypothetical protein